MTRLRALVFIVAFWPLVTFAQVAASLPGLYKIEGRNPDGQNAYRGEVAIVVEGDTYRVVWRIGGQQYAGTGILRDGKLAVVYQARGQAPGLALYDVHEDGTLVGTWTMLGAKAVGTETWMPQGRI